MVEKHLFYSGSNPYCNPQKYLFRSLYTINKGGTQTSATFVYQLRRKKTEGFERRRKENIRGMILAGERRSGISSSTSEYSFTISLSRSDKLAIYLNSVMCYNLLKGGVIMEKYAWKAKIVDGALDEYIRRHDAIWDEMKEVLLSAGIVNYTIWNIGNELFGYYECEKGIEYAARIQRESPIVEKWNEYMKDILIMELDPITGAQPKLTKVFSFN